jgi:hypothetical protein
MLVSTAQTHKPASDADGLAFLRCRGASPPAATRNTKTRVAHRRIKIERVYRPYLTLKKKPTPGPQQLSI